MIAANFNWFNTFFMSNFEQPLTCLPVHHCTVSGASTAHCTILALPNLTELPCMRGSDIISTWPMTAAND